MGLFGKLFEKKECSICGGEIGLLGNRKLEDGNCCKECAGKLSPWFDERRHSTVDQIKAQLAYREENQAALAGFRPSVAHGDAHTLRVEVINGIPNRFVVERYDGYMEENADLILFKDVTSFNIDVDESHRELKRRNEEGEMVSYNPPRFEYSYDFYVELVVNHPYFDDIRFRINRDTVNLETVQGRSKLGNRLMQNMFNPTLYPEYRHYRNECDELEKLFQAGMQGIPLNGQAMEVQPIENTVPVQETVEVSEYKGPKFCGNCGAPATGGKFCQHCGSQL